MDNMIYTAMTGAKNIMYAQSNNSHNLANVNTFGFKADLDFFKSEPVYGPGHPTRVYAEDAMAGFNHQAGTLVSTDNNLDVGIIGEGWIGVQAPDGTEAYTRRGDLHVDPNGLLTNGEGLLVLGNGGPISVPPNESLLFGRDGTITISPLGAGPGQLATIDRLLLVNPDIAEITKGQDGLFRLKSGENAEPDAFVQVTPGALESSNVNAVEAMVHMIEYARSFEAQIKLLKVAEEIDSATAKVMSIS